ncbi:MAG: cytochrome C [Deltaproteobacteria bacterium]|nr:cytochrome C [Deltaproteobacteria bacterium]
MKRSMIAGLTALVILGMIFLCVACAGQRQQDRAGAAAPAVTGPPTAVTTGPAAAGQPAAAGEGASDLYRDEPRPLKPVECGRCHRSEYERLRAGDSRHRFDCLKCHRQLHAYRPPAANYAAVMPKCGRCHQQQPHGPEFAACRRCHDPHAPKNIPFAVIAGKSRGQGGREVTACERCHRQEAAEMAAKPCKHNEEVGCTGCHADRHGVKPSCLDCHEPHVAGQQYRDCLVCHRPHSAGDILPYPENTGNEVCGSCHQEIAAHLRQNHTRHSELTCAACHRRHGQVPDCRQCHGQQPHDPAMLRKFPDCLQCHLDPHNLPEK